MSVSFSGLIRDAVLAADGMLPREVKERGVTPEEGEGLSRPLPSSQLLLPPLDTRLKPELDEGRLELRGRCLFFPFQLLELGTGGEEGPGVALDEAVGEGDGPGRVAFGARSPF